MDEQSSMKNHATINSYYFMTAIIGDVILGIVTQDAMLALFSFAFIFLWLCLNTRSWFLAFVGLLQIMFSIPVAWFIFTVVFRIKYFATLNSLALFVVAAIGADDICEFAICVILFLLLVRCKMLNPCLPCKILIPSHLH